MMKYYMYRESEGWGNKPTGSSRFGVSISIRVLEQVIRVDLNSNAHNNILMPMIDGKHFAKRSKQNLISKAMRYLAFRQKRLTELHQ